MSVADGEFGTIHPDAPSELAQFAFLLGTWDLEIWNRAADGSEQRLTGSWIGRYVLDGYAIADEARSFDERGALMGMGITYRSFQRSTGRWVMQWFEPRSVTWEELLTPDLPPVEFAEGTVRIMNRGAFPRITFELTSADSFTWIGETRDDDGQTWRRAHVVEARRAAAPPVAGRGDR